MNDLFYEQILPVKMNLGKRLLRLAVIILTIVLFLFLFLLGSFLGLAVGVLAAYLVYYLFLPKFKLEYEYSLTNSHLQIAAIYNKESRKEKFSLDLSSAEIIAPADSPRLHYYQQAKKLPFISSNSNLKTYSIILKKDQKDINVLIQPDDTMRDHMKNRVYSKMYFD